MNLLKRLKKMKGFTLIELLAVLVVLALIFLVVMPTVNSVMDQVRKSTFESSIVSLMKIADNECVMRNANGIETAVTYTFENGVQSVEPAGFSMLEFKGEIPENGYIEISADCEIEIAVNNGDFYIETDEFGDLKEAVVHESTEFTCGDEFLDTRDNKTYATVQIGTQCWFAENLKYTTPECLGAEWTDSAPYDACRTHGPNEGNNQGSYMGGIVEEVLYQSSAAGDGPFVEGAQGLCPNGWHIPSNSEWAVLVNFSEEDQGLPLKDDVNWNGTNLSGFTGLPTGYRHAFVGELNSVGSFAFFWSSTPTAWRYSLFSTNSNVGSGLLSSAYGYSIRCILNQG